MVCTMVFLSITIVAVITGDVAGASESMLDGLKKKNTSVPEVK